MSVEARSFVLAHDTARQRAIEAIRAAPDGYRVSIRPPGKTRDMEAKYHAQIADIAKQWRFMEKEWHAEDMKRLLVDAFAKAMRDAGTPLHHDGRIVPSIDGERIVQLGVQTSRFYKAEGSEFIEYLYAFGSEIPILWSEPHHE